MNSSRPEKTPRRNRFGSRFRMHGATAFGRAYETRVRRRVGPLLIYARPHGDLARTGDTRLGLSVSRRCGNAVRRHRLKRLIREAFRTIRAELPTGYDLLVVVHPHRLLDVEEYRRLLVRAAGELDRRWQTMPQPPTPDHDDRASSPDS
ncbi:MAG: ribonuclease P protein component [Phycisphaerales bacterium]|jgi:ribonuclease P protein component